MNAGTQRQDLIGWVTENQEDIVREVFSDSRPRDRIAVTGVIAMPTKSVHSALNGTYDRWPIVSVADLSAMKSSKDLIEIQPSAEAFG